MVGLIVPCGSADRRAAGGVIAGGAYDADGPNCGAGAASSNIAAYRMRNGPPTKQIIADKAAKNSNITSIRPGAKAVKTPSSGTIIAPISMNKTPCLTPFRRGEIFLSPIGSDCGSRPPWANNVSAPSNGKPHREQNRSVSLTCCWPHRGQNIGKSSLNFVLCSWRLLLCALHLLVF